MTQYSFALNLIVQTVKRRFIRQNREIARVNSTQSQRIRNLETEISRLVAENISLRERAIAAHADAERWRAASTSKREVLDLRDKMQQKMAEVGELLGEMGRIPEKVANKERRKSRLTGVGERMSSATEHEWRHRLSLRDTATVDGELNDGRLPAIREDKLFPRRTLENAELAALREAEALQHASESPELGPPPVAHFDAVGESIGLDSARTSEDDVAGEDVLPLPSNLERRRKRRTSALLQTAPTKIEPDQSSETSTQQPDLQPSHPPQPTLKSGAKRKLDVSELEEATAPHASSKSDDFIFQRRQDGSNGISNGIKKGSRFTRPPGREKTTGSEAVAEPADQAVPSTRKILAPKSTNSPTKRRVHVTGKLNDEWEDQAERAATKRQSRRDAVPPLDPENIAQVIHIPMDAEKILPPETPAAEVDGVLSPLSTEPSARHEMAPKEAAILNSVEDVLNGSIGRGSRRARAAVSYAEPNLRDKMRRPGKELVGAVEGLEKNKEHSTSVRGISVDRGRSESVKEPAISSVINVNIKQEKESSADDRWKQLPLQKKEDPTSPLRDKEKKERSGAAATRHDTTDGIEKALHQLSIFDPPVSSPMDASGDIHPGETRNDVPSTARRKSSTTGLATRRHSVQPPSSAGAIRETMDQASTARQDFASERRTSAGRNTASRPSSAASLRGERVTNHGADLKRSSSAVSNSRSSRLGEPDAGTNPSTRAERTLNRRRSMMV